MTRWGSEGNEDGQFADPEDIAVDSKTGNVYITDTGNSRIQVFSIAHFKIQRPQILYLSYILKHNSFSKIPLLYQ